MSVVEKVWNRRAIIADIERMIRDGEWPPGTRVPTREQLRDYYGATKGAVDGAIDYLVASRQLAGGVQGQRLRVPGGDEQETGGLPVAETVAEAMRPASTEDSPEGTDDGLPG